MVVRSCSIFLLRSLAGCCDLTSIAPPSSGTPQDNPVQHPGAARNSKPVACSVDTSGRKNECTRRCRTATFLGVAVAPDRAGRLVPTSRLGPATWSSDAELGECSDTCRTSPGPEGPAGFFPGKRRYRKVDDNGKHLAFRSGPGACDSPSSPSPEPAWALWRQGGLIARNRAAWHYPRGRLTRSKLGHTHRSLRHF
jgi:hypothetical protein